MLSNTHLFSQSRKKELLYLKNSNNVLNFSSNEQWLRQMSARICNEFIRMQKSGILIFIFNHR